MSMGPLPKLVEHLKAVAAQLNVQPVVHANGSPSYVVDLEGCVDNENGPCFSQHREHFRSKACLRPPELFS